MLDVLETSEITLLNSEGEILPVDGPVTVGRSSDVELVINDDQVSRRHAQLTPTEEGLKVVDLGSPNGTFLNGQRLQQFVAKDGDTITFYVHDYKVSLPERQPSEPEPEDHEIDATRIHIPTNTQSEPQPEPQTTQDPEPQTSRAWWETSEEGPVNTVLFGPGDTFSDQMKRVMSVENATSPRLLCVSGELAGTTYALGEGRFLIGRDEQCQIKIDNDGLSSQHAQIIHDGETWKLVNLLSSNGTFVKGERVQTAYLKSGDEIRLGPVTVIFQLPGSPASQPRQPSTDRPGTNTNKRPNLNRRFALLAVFTAIILVAGVSGVLIL